ncbi:MAG: ABC transporter permease [Clostridiales bacterium]|nr:ABC transporter permease [Clostridiales bacterium]
MVGLLIIVIFLVTALFAPALSPQEPNKIALQNRLTAPGQAGKDGTVYALGSDSLGRDILSRVIYGARVSLLVGLVAAALSMLIGCTLGLLAGYYGGLIDAVVMRLTDIQLAFPFNLLALTVLATLGGGLVQLILVMGVARWVQFSRIVRAEVLSIKEREYIQAAHAIGFKSLSILFRHVLPNVVAPIIVVSSFLVATNILSETTLSFLGLGVEASIPSWGSMLSEGRDFLDSGWWISTIPGLSIVFTVLGINLLGDWLRDYLDPKVL